MLKIDEDHEKKHKEIEAKIKFLEGMVDELIDQVGLKKAKGQL